VNTALGPDPVAGDLKMQRLNRIEFSCYTSSRPCTRAQSDDC